MRIFWSVKDRVFVCIKPTQILKQLISVYSLLSRVMRNIRWIMWLTLSCSHNSCRDLNERLISATESSFSSTLSDTEFSDSDWLSPESSTVEEDFEWPLYYWNHIRNNVFFEHMNMQNTTAESTHMVVRQTTAEICGLTQTAWHQPMSWRGRQKGCRRCSGCCCPGQSSHCGSALIPFKTPAFRGDKHSSQDAAIYNNCHIQCTNIQIVFLTFYIFETHYKLFRIALTMTVTREKPDKGQSLMPSM